MATLKKDVLTGLGLVLCMALIASPAAFAAGEMCAPDSKKIYRMGSGGAFYRGPIDTWDELSAYFGQEKVREEVSGMLTGSGYDELLQPLSYALSSPDGWSNDTWNLKWTKDVALEPGSSVDWMIFRGKTSRRPILGVGPYCMETKKSYEAWGLEVVKTEEKKCESITTTTYDMVIPEVCANLALRSKKVETQPIPKVAGAVCELAVTRSCEEGVFEVNAYGSSPEVMVKMGDASVSLGSNQRGTVADPDPFAPATFVAYVELADECAVPQTCKEAVTVEAEKRPTCEISAPEKVRAGKTFQVEVAGYFDSAEVVVTNEDGEEVATVSGPFPADLTLSRPGTYTLAGSGSTACGTSECTGASVEVPARWTLRGYPVFFLGSDSSSQVRSSIVGPDDELVETFAAEADDGFGIGFNAEYRPSDRIGVEFGLLTAEVDSDLRVDQVLIWGGQPMYEEFALAEEDLGVDILHVGVNFHLTPDKAVDFYVGPLIGLAKISGDYSVRFLPQDDLTPDRTISRDSDEFFIGAQVGLDIPIGKEKRWAVHLGAMFVDVSTSGVGGDLDIGPVLGTVGLAYRF